MHRKLSELLLEVIRSSGVTAGQGSSSSEVRVASSDSLIFELGLAVPCKHNIHNWDDAVGPDWKAGSGAERKRVA